MHFYFIFDLHWNTFQIIISSVENKSGKQAEFWLEKSMIRKYYGTVLTNWTLPNGVNGYKYFFLVVLCSHHSPKVMECEAVDYTAIQKNTEKINERDFRRGEQMHACHQTKQYTARFFLSSPSKLMCC